MAAEAMTEKDKHGRRQLLLRPAGLIVAGHKQILEHLEQAQRLDLPLTEHCAAFRVAGSLTKQRPGRGAGKLSLGSHVLRRV